MEKIFTEIDADEFRIYLVAHKTEIWTSCELENKENIPVMPVMRLANRLYLEEIEEDEKQRSSCHILRKLIELIRDEKANEKVRVTAEQRLRGKNCDCFGVILMTGYIFYYFFEQNECYGNVVGSDYSRRKMKLAWGILGRDADIRQSAAAAEAKRKVEERLRRASESDNRNPDIKTYQSEKETDEKAEKDETPAVPLPVKIKHYLDRYVFGQEEAKKVLAMSVAAFIKTDQRNPILLCGPTGCGKTYMLETLSCMRELRKEIGIAYYCATELTANGFKGDDVKDVIKLAMDQFHGKKGILFIDEIDKLLSYSAYDSKGSNVNEGIIHELLTAISGNGANYDINTNRILFVFGGAFENLEYDHRNRMTKPSLGFARTEPMMEMQMNLREELLRIGCSRQFLGRISRIVMMQPLDRESIRQVLLNEETGILVQKKKEFTFWGLELDWDESYLDAVIEQVIHSDQGARYGICAVENSIGTADYDMCENGTKRLFLTEESVNGRAGRVM